MKALRFTKLKTSAALVVGMILAGVAAPAAAGGDPRPKNASPVTGEPHVLQGHADGLAFSPDSKHLATSSLQGVTLWDVEARQALTTFRDIKQYGKGLVFTADGKKLIVATWDPDIKIYDIVTRKLESIIEPGDTLVHAVAINPKGTLLASAGREKVLKIWDPASGKLLHGIDAHPRDVQSVAFSADGKTLASCGYDSHVKLWDPVTGRALRTFENPPIQFHWDAVAFSPDGTYLVAVGSALRIIDLATGADRVNSKADDVQTTCAAVSPDGSLVATGGMNKVVKLWDPKTGKLLASLDAHKGTISSLAFSPNGAWLASAAQDRSIRLWPISAKGAGDLRPGEGTIVELEAREGIVRIALGAQHGIKAGDELEVFRTEPKLVRAGLVRVIFASDREAIARIDNAAKAKIQVKDRVAKKLTKE